MSGYEDWAQEQQEQPGPTEEEYCAGNGHAFHGIDGDAPVLAQGGQQ